MYCLLKYNFQKLKWNSLFKHSIITIILLILSNTFWGTHKLVLFGQVGLGFGSGIGFVFNKVSTIPLFSELLRSSLAYTGFFWILVLAISLSYTSSCELHSREEILISNNFSRAKLLGSKLIISEIFILLLYLICTYGSLFVLSIKYNFTLSPENLILALKYISLNAILLSSFLVFCTLLNLLIKKSENTSIFIFIYMIGGFIIFLLKRSQGSLFIKLFSIVNPYVNLLLVSSGNVENLFFKLTLSSILVIVIPFMIYYSKNTKTDYL